jgi:hypothetical protein
MASAIESSVGSRERSLRSGKPGFLNPRTRLAKK